MMVVLYGSEQGSEEGAEEDIFEDTIFLYLTTTLIHRSMRESELT